MPRAKGFGWSDDLPVPRPFPFQPVWDLLVTQHGCNNAAMRAMGWNGSRLKKLRDKGYLTFYEADRLAVAAGHHPSEIWGALWHPSDDLGALFERLRQEGDAA